MSDRSASIVYRAAMAIAAIWAAERLIEPAADAVASLNLAVAGRARGRDPRFAHRSPMRLRRLAPPRPRRGAAATDPWAPAERSAGRSGSSSSPPRSPATSPSPPSSSIRRSISPSSAACSISSTASSRTGPRRCSSPRRRSGRGCWRCSACAARAGADRRHPARRRRLRSLMIAIAAVLEPWGVQSQDMFGALRRPISASRSAASPFRCRR